MTINIHSDHILRTLRKPGESAYRIPRGRAAPHHPVPCRRDGDAVVCCCAGGMFELVSGANFLGEIVEWCGYALATWSLPAFAFAFFTACSIGPRAYHHHRCVTADATKASAGPVAMTTGSPLLSCRDYKQRFEDYPRSRAAIIPFLL